jgi:aerobic-type carbon monoxide dehydrogenase small subunit (CoxS/CutS family)
MGKNEILIICRCTGYVQIIEAVKQTALRLKNKR